MTKKTSLLLILLGVIVLTLAAWGGLAFWRGSAKNAEPETATRTADRTTQDSGKTTVTLSPASQRQSGIVAVVPQRLTHQPMLQTFGVVLDVSDLAALRSSDVAAQAQVEKAQATLDASAAEYHRLLALHENERDISKKNLQAAKAVWQGDEAILRAAQASLSAARLAAAQQWGSVLASAVADNAPLFQRLVSHQQLLVQVMLPAGASLTEPPHEARLQTTDGHYRGATLISPARRADPRLQGASLFYAVPADDLLPGMSVTAYLPTGAPVQGVVVPSSAVVWWQGKPWVYARSQPERFTRLVLPTNNPVEGGWFVDTSFAHGAPIVRTGAQLLLSEEQRSQISSDEGEGK